MGLFYTIFCVIAIPWNSLGVSICDIISSSTLCIFGATISHYTTCHSQDEQLAGHLVSATFVLPFVSTFATLTILVVYHFHRIPQRDFQALSEDIVEACARFSAEDLAMIFKSMPAVDLIKSHGGI